MSETRVTSAAVPVEHTNVTRDEAQIYARLGGVIKVKALVVQAEALAGAARAAVEMIQRRHADADLVYELRDLLHLVQESQAQLQDARDQIESLQRGE